MADWKFILFVYSLWVCYANAKIPEKCSGGPTLWCKNFTNAVDCNAYNHCFQTVWSTEKFSGDLCKPCESKIKNVRDVLTKHKSKNAILEAFENFCVLINCEQFDLTIKNYVDRSLNNLFDLLGSNLDDGQICNILNLCAFSAPAFEFVTDENVVARYDNVVLYLPASFLTETQRETPLLGAERCTWGPSYWCHNVTSSAECKTTSHCIARVWTTSKYAEDNDDVCKICKDMVKQARDQLLSNETQTELREVFEGSCKLIPVKAVAAECMKLADEFVPELTEMLASQMNPTAICTVAGLCNSPRIDELLTSQNTAEWDRRLDTCVNCTAALTAVERFMNTTSPNQVLEKLESMCAELSSYSEICTTLVNKHFDDIYAGLKREMKPFPVCHLNGMCSYRYHLHGSSIDTDIESKALALLASPRDNVACDLCKQMVNNLKRILVANTTEEEFLSMLKGLCEQTGKFAEECLQLVDNNYAIFYRYLTEELDANATCKELNVCPRKNFVSDAGLEPVRANVDVPQVSETLPIVCPVCIAAINWVKSHIKQPATEQEIEIALGEVCNIPYIIPNPNDCRRFINQHTDELMKLIANDVPSSVICGSFAMCFTSPNDKGLCELCELVLHEVDEILDDPKTQQSIEKAVGNVCSKMPKPVRNNCHEFINQYSSLIIAVLAEEVDPSVVCPAIKVCPGLAQPTRCRQCQAVVGIVIDGLRGDRRIERIAHQLQGVISSAKRTTLNATLIAAELKINHEDDLVEALSAEFGADESCVFLHFCEPDMVPASDGDKQDDGVASLVLTEEPPCDMCRLMIKLYEEKFFSNVTVQQIEREMLEICEMVHDKWARQGNCARFVDEYVPRLMEMLAKDVPPEYVCGLVRLCPQATATETTSKAD